MFNDNLKEWAEYVWTLKLCEKKKQNLYVVSIKEGEEIHTKCRENIFNKIMGKASLSKEREAPLYNQIDKNRNASENIIEKTVHEQKKENILKAAKEKKNHT